MLGNSRGAALKELVDAPAPGFELVEGIDLTLTALALAHDCNGSQVL
jgi:hypothetical protein